MYKKQISIRAFRFLSELITYQYKTELIVSSDSHTEILFLYGTEYNNDTYLLPFKLASTKVRIQWTDSSKLYGVICATSLTKNAKLSQHFIKLLGSCGPKFLSNDKPYCKGGTVLPTTGCISPSLPTYKKKHFTWTG